MDLPRPSRTSLAQILDSEIRIDGGKLKPLKSPNETDIRTAVTKYHLRNSINTQVNSREDKLE